MFFYTNYTNSAFERVSKFVISELSHKLNEIPNCAWLKVGP